MKVDGGPIEYVQQTVSTLPNTISIGITWIKDLFDYNLNRFLHEFQILETKTNFKEIKDKPKFT